jgi:DNA-binding beta-propeller fold protein YncE
MGGWREFGRVVGLGFGFGVAKGKVRSRSFASRRMTRSAEAMEIKMTMRIAGLGLALAMGGVVWGQKELDLPSSKSLGVVPGGPQRLNSLPMSVAVSPDGRWVVTVNAGYGTFESGYMESLAVMDTTTGKVEDFPESRTAAKAKQTLYSGLAFSGDGRHVYASMGSIADPEGLKEGDSGSGVVVYGFDAGKIVPERMLKIPLQTLAPGRMTKLIGGEDGGVGVPFPAAIAVLPGAPERVLVADNLSDDALLMDVGSGKVLTRFDLAESDAVPGTFPVALALSKDGKRAFVGLWNASEVVELDLVKGTVGRKVSLMKPTDVVRPGSHPCALAMSPDGRALYVALANRDAVAAIDVEKGGFAVKGYFDTRLPGQTYFGAEPDAVAVSGDGRRVYAGNMGSDAVAVLDTAKMTPRAVKQGLVEPVGFVPTEWMPTAMAMGAGDKLYLSTAKGRGTGPNDFSQNPAEQANRTGAARPHTYIANLLHGSLAVLEMKTVEAQLPMYTDEVLVSNRMKAAAETIPFHAGSSPIKHVIYIIKENRTYDQLFGDLPRGNGDKSLTMYGEEITPNQHAMALRFGVFDNFFDSGEVSGDGHVWSNAAIGTDYLEKTWEQNYRGGQRTYDYEGVVADGYPLEQKIADVNEPQSGYLWTNMAAHGKTLYHFGEYISTKFCNAKSEATVAPNSQAGAMLGETKQCSPWSIQPGGAIPEAWGGGVNKWPWAIPLIASNTATKPELVGHFAPEQPDFNLRVPDQLRYAVFARHLKQWEKDRAAGNDTMPNFIMLRLSNDHTAGTTPGGPTPFSSVADNDLAIGRAVEAVSHSAYWDDTAFFILEDDAQNGSDHVDAHRSMALIVSKYAPKDLVDSRFYSTVSMIRTMETVLGLPPMNNNDAFASLMGTAFSGAGDQAAFEADYRNRDNGLIYTANKKTAAGARASSKMDFKHADRADASKLNVILWQDAMGERPVPAMLKAKRKKGKKDDDDD